MLELHSYAGDHCLKGLRYTVCGCANHNSRKHDGLSSARRGRDCTSADMTTQPDLFDAAVSYVLKWEGGYSNDPDDPGGETNFGISKRAYTRTLTSRI